MLPTWNELFAPRPLMERSVPLALPDCDSSVHFAFASADDLRSLVTETFLTEVETARAREFRFGPPRENFTLGRLAAKLALAGANRMQCSANEIAPTLRTIEIGNGARGEPLVRDAAGFHSGLSLSHVNGRGVAVAFPATERIGLDLELIDAQRAETVRQAVPLGPEEKAWLRQTTLPAATALLLLWTAREALGKALGCGLACKWETLALREVATVEPAVFSGSFSHWPQFKCVGWIGPDAVATTAWETR